MPFTIPTAMYRLQLTADFGFDAATAIVPYLHAFGITHVYCSPFTQARPGSTHGYDVIDHNTLSMDLGGEDGFARFSAALKQHDMGLILDFVPNHMAASPTNPWWRDVLQLGSQSRYADYFDIDWRRPLGFRYPTVVLPILGKTYGQVLADGDLQLEYDGAEWVLAYFEHCLPISTAGAEIIERHGAETITSDPTRFHHLLRYQHYRLTHWRNAASEINYRRFFDINDLVGLRVDRAVVFDNIHQLVERLVRNGQLHGIRLDHIDGLYDPAAYCRRLTERLAAIAPQPIYLLVEKILETHEPLPLLPGVAGTTGYEWANLLTRCFVSEPGLRILNRFWRDIAPNDDPTTARRNAKTQVMTELFPGELKNLVRHLHRIAQSHWASSDLSADALRLGLIAYILELSVYRTYATETGINDADSTRIDDTIAAARARRPALDANVFDFLQAVLTLRLTDTPGYSRRRIAAFVFRLQQFTGPIMAKAIEDTLFYRDVRLLALNEVGGEPTATALSNDEFHRRMTARQTESPHGLTATATHDTKRGEDARLRIAALSEISENWTAAVRRWMARNEAKRAETAPTRTHEYLLYQSLIGTWDLAGISPDLISRLQAYAVKAARESKTVTSWMQPDESYEDRLQAFVADLLDQRGSPVFLSEFEPLARRAALLGALSSLGQVALKCLLPGVPDFYQGNELWDLSLVDPDNRRPVNYPARADLLTTLDERPDWRKLSKTWQTGAIKLALTRVLLAHRTKYADLFTNGVYAELPIHDETSNNDVLAFGRTLGRDGTILVVARQFAAITRGGRDWPDFSKMGGFIRLADDKTFQNIVGDAAKANTYSGTVALKEILGPLPIAILVQARI